MVRKMGCELGSDESWCHIVARTWKLSFMIQWGARQVPYPIARGHGMEDQFNVNIESNARNIESIKPSTRYLLIQDKTRQDITWIDKQENKVEVSLG